MKHEVDCPRAKSDMTPCVARVACVLGVAIGIFLCIVFGIVGGK